MGVFRRFLPVRLCLASSRFAFAAWRPTGIALALLAPLLLFPQQLLASSPTTVTALAITSAGNPVSTVAVKTVVTLTASVTANGAPVTLGTVNFCDATALSCTDIHLAGTAQLTSAGVAVIRFRPGTALHSYKAVFTGTGSYAGSSSAASSLAVSGTTTTTLAVTGSAGAYTLTGSLTASGAAAPTNPLSFRDITNGNYVLGTQSLGPVNSTLSFSDSSTTSIGSGNFEASTAAVGDLNRDGIPDIAVPDGSSVVKVLLGNGDGTFTAAADLSSPGGPVAAVIGDFNSDGKADLAVINQNSNTVTLFLGNGDGTFAASPSTPSTGSQSTAIATGDFNRDGKLDLAVTSLTDSTITVLLGVGDGTFTPAATVSTANGPENIITGDFNGDGNPDLAVAYNDYAAGCVSLFPGNGNGTFTANASLYSGTTSCHGIAAADVNQDGNLDLVVADFDNNQVYAFLGAGNGTFPSHTTTSQSDNHYSPASLAVGDFNGDGLVDFGTVSSLQDALSVGLGAGDGTFILNNNTGAVSSGGDANSVIAADLNGDGTTDVAIENGDGTLTAAISSVSQSFQATLTNISPVGTGAHQIQATYSGDAAYGASASNDVSLTAQPVPTGMVLGVTPAGGSSYGQQVVLTATLTPNAAQGHLTDGETVTFYNGNTAVGTASLAAGSGSLNLTSLAAGSDSLKAVYGGDTIFNASTSAAVSYEVTYPTTLTLAANPASSVYGQQVTLTATLSASSAQTLTANGESITFKNGSTILGTTALSSGVATLTLPVISASTVNLSASYAGDTDFAPAATISLPFTISPATPVVTWPPASRSAVYSGKPAGAALLSASSATAGTITYTATPALGPAVSINSFTVFSVGSYTLTATLTPADTTDYNTASANVAFTVAPAPLTVVPQPATRVYGAANPTLSGSVTGALNGDTFAVTGSTTANAASPVGSYPVTYSVTGTNLANYTVTQATGALSVTIATPSITWTTPAAITYGTKLSATQLDATSATPGTFAYAPSLGTVQPAGLQTLSVTFTPTDTTSYTTQTATVPLTVNKAAAAIAATSVTRVYGAANPAFSGTVTGAVNGDTFTVAGSTTATTTSPVGSYPIIYSLTGANLANYTVTQAAVTLTITIATPSIMWSAPAAITYGTKLSAAQLNATSATPGTFAFTPAAGSVPPAGLQTLSVIFTPTDATDYTTQTATVPLTINQAALAISATNFSRVYGAENPAFIGSVSGAVNGDTFTVAGTTTATTTSPVGNYPITYSVTGTNLADYTVTQAAGTLTVTVATPGIA